MINSNDFHSQKVYPFKTAYDDGAEDWDEEWAQDWWQIVEISNTIDKLEALFNGLHDHAGLHVSYMRDLTQKQMIINLRKYAYSLSKIIIEKYSE
jgi:hypothetical protein